MEGDETSEKALFCKMFNKFFDCMNTRSLYEGSNKRNEDLLPHNSAKDPRFRVRMMFVLTAPQCMFHVHMMIVNLKHIISKMYWMYTQMFFRQLVHHYTICTYILQWLKEVFLDYMLTWEAEVYAIDGCTAVDKERKLLSRETRVGLKTTGMKYTTTNGMFAF